jgi:hypothetical protein
MANYCFVAPIQTGGVDKLLSFTQYEIINTAEHDRKGG